MAATTMARLIWSAQGASAGTLRMPPASGPAMVASAKAPEKMPTSVMPICTVDRKRVGDSASASAARARASPLSASCRRRTLRDDTTASSDIASRPLSPISARMMRISLIAIPVSSPRRRYRAGSPSCLVCPAGLRTTPRNSSVSQGRLP